MKTKAEYIRDAWQVYCKVYHIPHDETDVYTRGGHWYGQCRKVVARYNMYTTILMTEWLITFKLVDKDTAELSARLLRTYK